MQRQKVHYKNMDILKLESHIRYSGLNPNHEFFKSFIKSRKFFIFKTLFYRYRERFFIYFMKNAEYYSTSDSLFVEREIYGETRAAVVAGSHSGGLVEIGQKGLVALKAHGGMDLHNG